MQIGIVKEKYSKPFRLIFYIGFFLFLIATYPLLMQLNIGLGLTLIVFSLIGITGFIFIDKVVEDIILLGNIEIRDDSFVIDLEDDRNIILFKEIKMILLKPKLGGSTNGSTSKVYVCQIKTIDELYSYHITREEIRNGKLIARNLMRPKAFDFIQFLEKQKINHRIGKRSY